MKSKANKLAASATTASAAAGAKSAPVLHFGITCDGSNQRPLVGKRYHKIGEDYDLNETEFTKIPRHEQLKYEVIAIPGAIPVPVTPATKRRKRNKGNATASATTASSTEIMNPGQLTLALQKLQDRMNRIEQLLMDFCTQIHNTLDNSPARKR